MNRVYSAFSKPNLAILFIAAVLLKLILIWALIGTDDPGWATRFGQKTAYDDTEYYNIAKILSTNHEFAFPDSAQQPEPQIYRTPLYPLFLSGVGILSNWQPMTMLIVQAAILSLIPVVLCLVLRQLDCVPGYSWLLVIDPITNLLSISFMTEGLLVLMLIGTVYFLSDAENKRSRLMALSLLGVAILVKPSVQFFYVALCLYVIVRYRPRQTTLALVLFSMLPILAWMARNYHEAGLFVVSTQKNAAIMAVETIKAKENGIADSDLVKHITLKWSRDHDGENLYKRIMSNHIEFTGVASDYIRTHPVVFVKYHLLGMVRVLMGTARSHIHETLPRTDIWSSRGWSLFNGFMVAYYLSLYAGILATFRLRSLRSEMALVSWGFVCYNLVLIGVLAYTTGGGLKRAPFIPFLIIILALQMRRIQNLSKRNDELALNCSL